MTHSVEKGSDLKIGDAAYLFFRTEPRLWQGDGDEQHDVILRNSQHSKEEILVAGGITVDALGRITLDGLGSFSLRFPRMDPGDVVNFIKLLNGVSPNKVLGV